LILRGFLFLSERFFGYSGGVIVTGVPIILNVSFHSLFCAKFAPSKNGFLYTLKLFHAVLWVYTTPHLPLAASIVLYVLLPGVGSSAIMAMCGLGSPIIKKSHFFP
jgi:hypothetical protein